MLSEILLSHLCVQATACAGGCHAFKAHRKKTQSGALVCVFFITIDDFAETDLPLRGVRRKT